MVTHRLHLKRDILKTEVKKDVKSKKYTGVYHRILEDGSKSFYITYKHPILKKSCKDTVGKSKDGFTEIYCSNLRNEVINKLRLGEDTKIPIIDKKQQHTTLDDLSVLYFDYKNINGITKSTKDRQSKYNKHIKPLLGHIHAKSITKQDGAKLQKKLLSANYAHSTINSMVEMVATIFNTTIKEEVYKGVNPFYGIKKFPINNARLRYLSLEEIALLKEEVKDDEVLYLFVLIAVSTGARLESVLSMQKKDINLDTGLINIHDLKNKDRYNGGITADVKSILIKTLKALKKDDYIVSYDEGEKMDVKRIQRPLSAILNKLFNSDLQDNDRANRTVIHTLRHTFASLLVINGVDIYRVQKLMNHKDISQTIRYAKLAPDSGISEVMKIF